MKVMWLLLVGVSILALVSTTRAELEQEKAGDQDVFNFEGKGPFFEFILCPDGRVIFLPN